MEHMPQTPEVYDFRQYDRIWQRVAPNLEPYPGMAAQPAAAAQQTAPAQPAAFARSEASAIPAAPALTVLPAAPEAPAVPVPAGPDASLPGAEQNPCCMGTEAEEMLEVITGYIEAALSDRRYLLALTDRKSVV